MTAFGSLWIGDLTPFEEFCLSSFAEKGHNVTLFSYEIRKNLPNGVTHVDARELLDISYTDRFITDSRKNIAHFSDYFRYLMFQKTDLAWIDTDVLLLGELEIRPEEEFLVCEDGNNVCNAILRIPSGSEKLKQIISSVENIFDRDVPWAATQNVIRNAYQKEWGALGNKLRPAETYMPVHYNDFHKLILPEFYDECVDICKDAVSIHLYNNILGKIGYCKYLRPPKGSYLGSLIEKSSSANKFWGSCPPDVAKALVDGWFLRFSGECLGTGAVIRQFLPSLKRSARKYLRT